MAHRSLLSALSGVVVLLAGTGAFAQGPSTSARPSSRITARVDSAVTTQLANTHPRVVERAIIGERLSAAAQLTNMRLLLSSSDEQVYALRSLLDEQQDKTSPNFHKWLTPESFGQSFGASQADLAKITAWLQDQGFTVNSIAKSNRLITFSGTAGQVEAAFHTQLNHITVDGEAHISNVTDIAVPAALSSVVRGIASLNDFEPKSNIVNPHKAQISMDIPANNYITPNATPLYTSVSSGNHYVGPGDAAVIFNSTPLLSAGIDGTGQTVAVLGRSNINLSDVQQFRSMFGLKKNDPTFTVLGNDPGLNGDQDEAFLDVEWAGGMAPGAKVNFIVAGPDRYIDTSGINAAGLYAVDNNIGDIITLSYGGCETTNGTSGTAFWNTLWEQAAAQGQTVFISSGDSNATGCSSSSAAYGTAYGVNALGSSAYNVAVGGSMFVDFGPSQYWSAGVSAPAPAGYNFTTANSYIPEAVWNEGALSTTLLNGASTATVTGSGIVGGGGGISIYTARPSWQTGSGISATADPTCSATVGGTCYASGGSVTGLHRLVPDISFIASGGHDATIFCGEGSCQNNSSSYGIGAIGGTSVATPVMASVQALINQKNGGRQGNANFFFYPLANRDFVSGNCKSTNGTAATPTVTLPASTCNFHDIIAGDNRSPQNATDTTGLGFYAGTGYDAASGLGSVNIANVANNWSTVSFTATTTKFTLSPAAGIAHGATQLLSVQVTPTTASGTPTGDVSLIAETTNPSEKLRYTLASGTYSGSISGLPAGSYSVHVHYEGDGTFAASDSASIPVNITQEASTITNTLRYTIPTSASGTSTFASPTSIPYGAFTLINTQIAGATSGNTTQPTGTFTYSVALNGSTIGSISQAVDGFGAASFQSGAVNGIYYQNANFPVLAPGSYVVTTSYSGDSTYSASSTTVSFTVVKGTPFLSLTSSSAYISSGQPITLNYSVTRPNVTTVTPGFVSLSAQPTGTVTFSVGATTLGTATLNANGIASLVTQGITATGANTVTATYVGDSLWNTASSTATVTVGTGTATTTTLSISGTYYVGSVVPISATVTPAVAGTVTFYDNGVRIGSATSSSTTGIATLSTSVLGTAYAGYTGFTNGSHTVTATFAGTSTYAASTGTLPILIGQNVTTLAIEAPVASIYGQTVAVAARLVRSPTIAYPLVAPSGTVTFYDGSTQIGTGNLVYQSGYGYFLAMSPTVLLSGGTHTLTASYAGDSNFSSSTTGSVTLTVSPVAPAITLSSTATVYASSGPVSLTATIPLSAALTAPTSLVRFLDNGTPVGSATLAYSAAAGAYVANASVTLAAGVHSITAALAADSNYAAVTSAALAITVDTNNVWVANSNGSISALNNAGSAVTSSATSGGGTGIVIDNAGSIWSLNKTGNSVAKFTNSATPTATSYAVGGINAPTALAIDGSGIVWITNGNGTLSGVTAAGTAATPTAFASPTLSSPTSIKVDATGSLWITNAGDNSITEVIGVATPVTTPQTTAVRNAAPAAKP